MGWGPAGRPSLFDFYGGKLLDSGNLMDEVCSWENLVQAYYSARKCKRTRLSVLEFEKNRERNLLTLQDELSSGTYRTGKYRRFKIYEPKERDIMSLPFRDRVAQHAIYRVIEPIFDRSFHPGSFACRKGRGTKAALERAARAMRKKGCEWYLYCDISKFFASIDIAVLKKLIARKIKDERLLNIIGGILDSTRQEKGMPIGNLLSQLFANVYLNELDFHVAHSVKPRGYVRYMDDIIAFFDSKDAAKKARDDIEKFLREKLRMSLNGRTRVGRSRDRLAFCGALVRINGMRKKRAALNRAKRKVHAWKRGAMRDCDIVAVLGSCLGFCKGTRTAELLNGVLFGCLKDALIGCRKVEAQSAAS